VAVLALQISSDQLTGSQLYDMASNLIRPMLVSVPGVAVPAPYGGTADRRRRNSVLVGGHQAVLLAVLKAGDASTLAVVAGVKAKIPPAVC
jgi:multidrug efflux pump subunit AcrB